LSEPADAGFDIEVPDIPLPSEAVDKTVKDTFEGAFKFAFVGLGQGGSRIAQAFYDLGYRRVCAINTAEQDMRTIRLPEANKLVLGGGGAGKDPAKASRAFGKHSEDVLDLLRRCCGPGVERVFVCSGAGGGTGNGGTVPMIAIAGEFMQAIREPVQVGVITALPKDSEGQRVCANAYNLLERLARMAPNKHISPLIVLDNERISQIYPGLAVDPFWATANRSVATLFHLFNTIAIRESHYTAFDQTDYRTLLDSGIIVFGATPVAQWQDATDVSKAVRDNLQRNMLAGGIDLSTGSVAGAIIIGGQQILTQVPQESLDHAFEQLSRTLKGGNTVHRGIYRGNKDNLVVYTMIGGLGAPAGRLNELQRLGGITE
jgi:cell division GTPase FtsZ